MCLNVSELFTCIPSFSFPYSLFFLLCYWYQFHSAAEADDSLWFMGETRIFYTSQLLWISHIWCVVQNMKNPKKKRKENVHNTSDVPWTVYKHKIIWCFIYTYESISCIFIFMDFKWISTRYWNEMNFISLTKNQTNIFLAKNEYHLIASIQA